MLSVVCCFAFLCFFQKSNSLLNNCLQDYYFKCAFCFFGVFVAIVEQNVVFPHSVAVHYKLVVMRDVERLIRAAKTGDEERLRRLISEGVDVNKCKGNTTALITASYEGHKTVAAILLENGAAIDQPEEDGWTALIWAACNNQVDIVKLLLSCGAAVDTATKFGNTALAVASWKGRTAAVAVLLDHNADINAINIGGTSPLMYASMYGHESVVRLLVARNDLDTTLRNGDGKDCLDCAKTASISQLIVKYRWKKAEKQRLIDIGLGFAAKELPILQLVLIYEQSIVFDDQCVSLFNCWEILKLLKRRGGGEEKSRL